MLSNADPIVAQIRHALPTPCGGRDRPRQRPKRPDQANSHKTQAVMVCDGRNCALAFPYPRDSTPIIIRSRCLRHDKPRLVPEELEAPPYLRCLPMK